MPAAGDRIAEDRFHCGVRNSPRLFPRSTIPVVGKCGATAHHPLISPNEPQPAPSNENVELFPLGRVVATPGVLADIPEQEVQAALRRHHTGDWGQLDEHDWQENQKALSAGFRLLSAYTSSNGFKFWIITEWDRSVTTVLLPEEY